VLCFLLEAVIVALVHVLLAVLLCAIWPSSTAAAIASLILRPAATINPNPATPSASEEPPRDVRVGDCVVRRGELCTVIAIDRSVMPIGVTVQNQKTGMVAHTELAFLSLPADCTATPPPTLPPPRLPLLRLLMLPLYIRCRRNVAGNSYPGGYAAVVSSALHKCRPAHPAAWALVPIR
jgi:hypothetical protein